MKKKLFILLISLLFINNTFTMGISRRAFQPLFPQMRSSWKMPYASAIGNIGNTNSLFYDATSGQYLNSQQQVLSNLLKIKRLQEQMILQLKKQKLDALFAARSALEDEALRYAYETLHKFETKYKKDLALPSTYNEAIQNMIEDEKYATDLDNGLIQVSDRIRTTGADFYNQLGDENQSKTFYDSQKQHDNYLDQQLKSRERLKSALQQRSHGYYGYFRNNL